MTTVSVQEFRLDPDQYLAATANGDVVVTQDGEPWLVLHEQRRFGRRPRQEICGSLRSGGVSSPTGTSWTVRIRRRYPKPQLRDLDGLFAQVAAVEVVREDQVGDAIGLLLGLIAVVLDELVDCSINRKRCER